MNSRNLSVSPADGGAVVEFACGPVFVPVALEDGLPVAYPSAEFDSAIEAYGMTGEESEEILWDCEHATAPADIPDLVRGRQIFVDLSGVGHCWVEADSDSLPATVREEIEAEIKDGWRTCRRYCATNGRYYRW